MKIIEKKENPLLSRTEILAEISFEKATPPDEEVKKQIASQLKVDEALVVVKNIYTEFGSPNAKVTAFIYDSKKALEKTEPKPKEKKEAKKPAEKPVEVPKEPKKEVKEEKKEATPAASGTQTSESESDSSFKEEKVAGKEEKK